MVDPIVSTREHYERLAAEGHDPFHDGPALRRHMCRWDGPAFWELVGNVAKLTVLEVGIGTGRLATRVLQGGCAQLVGLDISPATLARCAANLQNDPRVELIEADITTWRRRDAFDLVYAVLTLSHVQANEVALANMVASMRPGGRIILSVENAQEWLHYGNHRVRLHPTSPEWWAEQLERSGCTLLAVRPSGADESEAPATLLIAQKPRNVR